MSISFMWKVFSNFKFLKLKIWSSRREISTKLKSKTNSRQYIIQGFYASLFPSISTWKSETYKQVLEEGTLL